MTAKPTFLCLASYKKGDRFLIRAKQEGCKVFLLTVEKHLRADWPREHLDEVFALKSFDDLDEAVNAVGWLAKSRKFDRIIALDDYDVATAAHLREHLRLPGLGESRARLFRDKLAMRVRARELGIRVPEFVHAIHTDDVRHFLASVPGPWLIKPRGEASSAGIQKHANADEALRAVEALGDRAGHHLLERMVPGDLFHVDALTVRDEVRFAEVGGYYKPLLEVAQGGGLFSTQTLERGTDLHAALLEENRKVLTRFGLGYGASHTEFMRAHDGGELYFIETAMRVGGAHIAELTEATRGVNLWSEWAKIEIDGDAYELPATTQRYGGIINSLTRFENPDQAPFDAPEIVHRLTKKHHVGLVLAGDDGARVASLLDRYRTLILREYSAALPQQKHGHTGV
jgi:hypothetical protein